MAWRIADSVIKGEIDNRIKGKVTGQVWLVGVAEPVRLELEGNAWRDVAGSLLTFRNPHAQPADSEPIAPLQQGVCGDMTASPRSMRCVFPIPRTTKMIANLQPIIFPTLTFGAGRVSLLTSASTRRFMESLPVPFGPAYPQ